MGRPKWSGAVGLANAALPVYGAREIVDRLRQRRAKFGTSKAANVDYNGGPGVSEGIVYHPPAAHKTRESRNNHISKNKKFGERLLEFHVASNHRQSYWGASRFSFMVRGGAGFTEGHKRGGLESSEMDLKWLPVSVLGQSERYDNSAHGTHKSNLQSRSQPIVRDDISDSVSVCATG
ncbi:hypothetical protein BD779DRAFT_1479901 [Infundibulicybe gibba]|nr:hypothetical protein BD779DRAFT_1479901 [Infundibulicybe gibba]